MTTTEILRAITIAIMLTTFLVWKAIIKSYNDPNGSVSRRTAISSLSLLVAVISAAFRPVEFISHIIGILALHQGTLFAYIVVQSIYANKNYSKFWHSKTYIAGTCISLIVFILDFIRKDNNLGSFLDIDTYTPNFIYFTSYYLTYGLMCYMMLRIIVIDANDLKRRKISLLFYKLKRYITLYGFMLAYIGMFTILVNLTLSIFIGDTYRQQINAIYQIERLFFVLMLSIGSVFNKSISNFFLYPIRKIINIKQQKEQNLLLILHNIINNIVDARLPNQSLAKHRIMYEISDARDKILSNFNLNVSNVEEEANIYYKLYSQGIKVNDTGQEVVYQPLDDEEERYYIGIARHLKLLQNQ